MDEKKELNPSAAAASTSLSRRGDVVGASGDPTRDLRTRARAQGTPSWGGRHAHITLVPLPCDSNFSARVAVCRVCVVGSGEAGARGTCGRPRR
eukprot:4720432-Prymnesium_polylepis.1